LRPNVASASVKTFASISRRRRLARDFERYAATMQRSFVSPWYRIMLKRLSANASS
jgi:hypothetical protein